MDNVEFDLVMLKNLCGIDVRSVIKGFSSYEEYFQELYRFIKNSKYYLRSSPPNIIIRDESECKAFCEELRSVKSLLLKLGLDYPLSTLSELEYEVRRNDANALAMWLRKFYTEIEKVVSDLISAKTIEMGSQQVSFPSGTANDEKPIVLAVDDKPELLTSIVVILEDRFKVMAATSGMTALKVIEKYSPALFLLDIEMPQMDGFELTEHIRKQKQFEETPIIFLTSQNTRSTVISAIQNGGNDYILKPVTKDLLLAKILRHLGSI